MAIKINTKPQPKFVERKVSGDFGEFTIKVRMPTIPERIKARSLWYAEDKIEERMQFMLAFLAGWDGINDEDGNPVPFDGNYQTVLGPNEAVLMSTVFAIMATFDANLSLIAENDAKNSEAPLGHTDVAAAATPTSSSSTT